MLKAQEMMALFQRAVVDYHREDRIDQTEPQPFAAGSLEALLYAKAWIDTVQWHLEDLIRDPEILPSEALALKRRIDSSNQARTDCVEQLDDRILGAFQRVTPLAEARLNTESPGWAIDRLSILALKLYHMGEEAQRRDSEAGLRQKNAAKLAILQEQERDLCTAIDQLLADLADGRRKAKVYRQMKMYNDPALNPVLYRKKS